MTPIFSYDIFILFSRQLRHQGNLELNRITHEGMKTLKNSVILVQYDVNEVELQSYHFH